MFEFEPIEVPGSGRRLEVRIEHSNIRTMRARIVDGTVLIKVPVRWNRGFAEKSAETLYNRMKRMVERHPERALAAKRSRMSFKEGSVISPLGRQMQILVDEKESGYATARFDGSIRIRVPSGLTEVQRSETVSRLTRRVLARCCAQDLEKMARDANLRWFSSNIGAVRIRDNTSTWGTCSKYNDITISLRLLFMPQELLEYVMVHELAHTKVRGHGKRFWSHVASALPDYKERRKALRKY